MKKTLLIEVTQEDIDAADADRLANIAAGRKVDAVHCCPIALSLARLYPDHGEISVDTDLVSVIPPDTRRAHFLSCWTTETVREFMDRWDRCRRVRPHRFRVAVR